MIHIGIDAMGSDKGSKIFIESCKRFVKDYPCVLEVYGDQNELKELSDMNNIIVHHTTQVMEMTDGPLAVRRKKDSSMVQAITDLSLDRFDGVLSCGGTGALLSCGVLLVKTLPGIDRAAIMTTLPNEKNSVTLLLDIGANADNTPEQLICFAKLAKAYSQKIFKVENPSIGLLNIGSEKEKGDQLHKDTNSLMQNDETLNFYGNIEADNVLNGNVDIIVTDGFSGNILLKCLEGTSKFIIKKLKENLMSSFITKIGALISKKAFKKTRNYLDASHYGGALIIGLNKPIVKSHGSADSRAIYNALKQLYSIIDNDVIGKIKEDI